MLFWKLGNVFSCTFFSDSHFFENHTCNFRLFCHTALFFKVSSASWQLSSVSEEAIILKSASTSSLCIWTPCCWFVIQRSQACSLWKSHRYTVESRCKEKWIFLILSIAKISSVSLCRGEPRVYFSVIRTCLHHWGFCQKNWLRLYGPLPETLTLSWFNLRGCLIAWWLCEWQYINCEQRFSYV